MTSKEFIIWLGGFLDACDDLNEEGIKFIQNKMKEVKDDLIDYVDIQPVPYQYNDYKYLNPCPMGGQHEYPDIWHGVIPPPCKKCGYSEPQSVVTWCNAESFPQYSLGQGMSYIEFEVPVDSTVSRVCNSEGGIDTMSIKVPLAPQPQMTADDYAFSTNGENIEMIANLCQKMWFDKPVGRLDNVMTVGEYQKKMDDLTDKIKYAMSDEVNKPNNYNKEDMEAMLNSANDVNKDAPKPDGYMDYTPPYTKMNWEIPVSEDAFNCCNNKENYFNKPIPNMEPKSWKQQVSEQIGEAQKLVVQEYLDNEFVEYEIKPEYRQHFGEKNYIRFKNTPENIEIYRNILVNPPELNPELKTVRDNFREGYIPIEPLLDYLQREGVEQRVIWGLKEYYLFHKHNL